MRHEEAHPRLAELVGVHDAGPDEAELREHVACCARCRDRLAAISRVDAALRASGPPAPLPEGLERRVLAVPEEHLQRPAPRRRRLGIAAAAGVALAAAAGLAVGLSGRGEAERPFTPDRKVTLSRVGSPVRAVIEMEASSPSGRIRLTVRGLKDVGVRAYRLWLRGEAGEVALGPFRPGYGGRCVVVLEAPPGEWTHAAITTVGGSPEGDTMLVGGRFAPL